jgi:ferrous-iron efflux pump FieF
LAAVIISAFIFWAALTFGKDSVFSLMDVSPQPAMRKGIEDTILSTPEVKGVHALRVRRSGLFIFVEAHVEVDGRTSLEKAHMIADEVQDRVQEKFKEIDSMAIHIGIHEKHS